MFVLSLENTGNFFKKVKVCSPGIRPWSWKMLENAENVTKSWNSTDVNSVHSVSYVKVQPIFQVYQCV